MVATYGLLSLIPVAVVIVTAVITKRAVEPLVLGSLVGFFIIDKWGFLPAYLDALYCELGESGYYVIIFGLFGIFLRLIEDTNATSGFTRLGMKFANNKKKAGILSIVLGLVMFLDNYFSILSAGVSTRDISDKNKISREMFAFTINSIACCTCVIVPISLWGIFMSGQIETVLGLGTGEGTVEIVKSIPFIAFAWVLIIFVVLYNLRIIKPFGKMKAAEARAEMGKKLPDDIDDTSEEESGKKKETSIWNFVIPMVIIIGITLITSELMWGLILGIVSCFILFIAQKLITPVQAFDSIHRGFEEMFVVTAIVISAFVLQDANDALGLAPFVVNSVVGIMSASLLPVIAFLILWVLGFVTGSFWGMMAVCFPIILPLATQLDCNMYLVIGAIISGAAAGSATCFYGDSITLTCGFSKLRNNDYLTTCLPMVIPPIIVSAIVFTVFGFVL